MARLPILALFALLCSFLFAAPAVAQDKNTQFRLEFDKAAKIGSKSKMDSLMRDGMDEGVFCILNTAMLISNSPNDVLYERFEALSGSWTRCFESNFPSKMERFWAKLDANQKRNRYTQKQKFDKVNREQAEANAAKDKKALLRIADEYESLVKGFEELGDRWMVGQCYIGLATALEETYHGKKADLRRVAAGYARFIAIREDLGVKDRTFKQSAPRLKSLEALGFGGGGESGGSGGSGGGAAAAPAGPKSTGAAVTAKLAFEAFKAVKDTQRPNYYLDEHRQIWPTVVLQGKGSTGKFVRVADSPTMTRAASSKVTIEGGGVDDTWPLRGKLEPVTFELGTGPSKRRWAVLCDMGREVDYYQGITMNLGMTDTSLSLYFLPGGAMEGEVAGEKVEIVDDNFDGIYGSLPQSWEHFGIVKGAFQPEFDSIRVGGAKKAQPFSEYVNLGGAGWHKLEALNGGVELKAQPFEFKTGTVQLKSKGLKPDYYVLKGVGKDLENTYIDVSGGKKVEVPIGRWELCFGLVRKGKKMQMMKGRHPSDGEHGRLRRARGQERRGGDGLPLHLRLRVRGLQQRGDRGRHLGSGDRCRWGVLRAHLRRRSGARGGGSKAGREARCGDREAEACPRSGRRAEARLGGPLEAAHQGDPRQGRGRRSAAVGEEESALRQDHIRLAVMMCRRAPDPAAPCHPPPSP